MTSDSSAREEMVTLNRRAMQKNSVFFHFNMFLLSLPHVAICVPFEIAPADDTSCTLRKKPTACGNNLQHCVPYSDEQRPLIPNVAEHWTQVMTVLRKLTRNNEAETRYLFHLPNLHWSEGKDFEILYFLTVVF